MKRLSGYLTLSVLILVMLTSCIPGEDESVQANSEEMASASWVVDPEGVTEFSSIVSQTAEVNKGPSGSMYMPVLLSEGSAKLS